MKVIKTPSRFRTASLACALLGLTGLSQAEPVSKTLDYDCTFPMIGEQPLSVDINTNLPATIKAGDSIKDTTITAISTVSEGAWNGLYFVGSRTLDGAAEASALLQAPNFEFPLSVPMTLDTKVLPDTRTSFQVDAQGKVLDFTIPDPGEATITVGDLVLSLNPTDHQGLLTGLGEFEAECSLQAGQDSVLHTITVQDDSQTELAMTLEGESHIEAGNSNVTLNGDFNTVIQGGTGDYTGTLALEPTRGHFEIIHFFNMLAANADMVFEPAGDTTGTLEDGNLTASTPMHLALPRVEATMFGFPMPIGGGADCRTSEPFELNLETPTGSDFDPAQGGTLTGTYTLPPVENCGGLEGIINTLIAGPGNTVQVSLTPST